MEKLHLRSILHLLFLLFYSLPLLVSSYNPECKYFMNCGSDSNVSLGDDRTFVGDLNSDPSFSVGQKSQPFKNNNPSSNAPPLYQTARIYRQTSPYVFNIIGNGTYLVRLHFFEFSSDGTNLADALFNVSTPNFMLLSNFRVQNNSSNLPVIREFFLYINVDKFKIYFIPAKETSFAFVNAIEVFLLPPNFTIDNPFAGPPLGSGNGTRYQGLFSNALQTRYRIDVGGQEANNDSLWRKWVPDDDYLTLRGSAKNYSNLSIKLIEGNPDGIEEFAPDIVYKTCKVVTVTKSGGSNFTNTTWRFDATKKAKHLVRLHFCDIVSKSPGASFYLYIYKDFRMPIKLPHLAQPYFYDIVLDSDDYGYINISISPDIVSPDHDSFDEIAFLNGLEIMEFVMNTSFIEPPTAYQPKKRLFVIIGAVGGAALMSIFMILLLLGLRYRIAKPVKAQKVEVPLGRGTSWITERADNVFPLPNLKLKMPLGEILAATENFDTKLLIGEGGFGKVYKGTLQSGMKVAVKRSDSSHGQGLPEFQTEVMVLSKIRHRHLVSLIGYCDEGAEMILAYEFMEKGTLRDHLYDCKKNSESQSTQSELNWRQRLEICIGAAKGLHYLHTGSDRRIIHRDVKSTNILLDEHYVAKVADFGLSQSGPDEDHFSMGVRGSFGYLDPEFFRTLQLTDKSDVYSFGVVLCEILCARPPIVNSPRREEINLAEWVLFWQNKEQLEKIIDPSLACHINPNSLRKFAEIAEKCLRPAGADRPTMLDVSWDLEYALQLQQTAVHREPHEDSTTDASSDLMLLFVQRLNSNGFANEEDCQPIGDDDAPETTASGVFSQCRIDGAR